MRTTLGVAAASAVFGALALLGVLTSNGTFDSTSPSAARTAATTVAPADRPVAVGRATASVVQLRVTAGDTTSHGVGIVLRSDGEILTSSDLVRGATSIVGVLTNGRQVSAKIVGADPDYDLAVIRITTSALTPISLGRAADLRLGDTVFAITASTGESHPPVVSRGAVLGLRVVVATEGRRALHGMTR